MMRTEESKTMDNVFTLDSKVGDVTGDGVPDLVYLTGHKADGPSGLFADNITLVIQDGLDGSIRAFKPKFNAGYNARLFLGDFDGDGTDDIKISIDAGGSGGYGIHYVDTFKNYAFRTLFDFETYNAAQSFKVDYLNDYRVSVACTSLNKLYILDLVTKGPEYLSQFYRDDGTLIKPTEGEVLALGALMPVAADARTPVFGLLAYRRIIGTTNADTLGFMENLLFWDGTKFATKYLVASIPGTDLMSHF
jgi:hypothetical protein